MHNHVATLGRSEWPQLQACAVPGKRHVTITRRLLTPPSAQDVGLIVVAPATLRAFEAARWPIKTKVILNRRIPPVEHPEPPFAADPNDELIDLSNKPLRQSLREIEQVCKAFSKTSVAVDILPGFEDEAADLLWWREQAGQIKRIVFHVRCAGHYIDFAKAADVLD